MSKLIFGVALILCGLWSIVDSQERPPYEQALGVVAVASEADCAMLLNLTDDIGECYYTFANKSGVESILKRYAKFYELEVDSTKVYDATALRIGEQLIMVRKSDELNVYVVLICQ